MLNFKTSTEEDFIAFARSVAEEVDGYPSHEAISQHLTQRLYEAMQDGDGPILQLVRVYRLCKYDELPYDLKQSADPQAPFRMVLTGTYGVESAWRDRGKSQSHKLIPVEPGTVRTNLPMFEYLLVGSMGVDLDVLYQTHDPIEATQTSISGLVHIEDAFDSRYIPAQKNFVRPYGIESLVGFGGLLAGVNRELTLYAMLAFSRQHIDEIGAANFQAMQPFVGTMLANTGSMPAVFSS